MEIALKIVEGGKGKLIGVADVHEKEKDEVKVEV